MRQENFDVVSARDDALLAVIATLVNRLDEAGLISKADLIADLEQQAGPPGDAPQHVPDRRAELRAMIAGLRLERIPL